jgi:asparagine N-glycosylation enzyme membrane subunit Stt3
MKRISLLLIAMALIAGMAGCFTPFRMQFQLNMSSTEGGRVVTPGEGVFVYWQGTEVNLVAEADDGYRFVEWTGDPCTCNIADVDAASTSIMMNNDYFVVANFEETAIVQYRLAINSTEGGNVTAPGVGEFTYDEGTIVDLVAEADEGYFFLEWTGNVSTVADVHAASTNITINGDYEITANFGSLYADDSGTLVSIGLSMIRQ